MLVNREETEKKLAELNQRLYQVTVFKDEGPGKVHWGRFIVLLLLLLSLFCMPFVSDESPYIMILPIISLPVFISCLNKDISNKKLRDDNYRAAVITVEELRENIEKLKDQKKFFDFSGTSCPQCGKKVDAESYCDDNGKIIFLYNCPECHAKFQEK